MDRFAGAALASGARTTATYDGDGKRRSYADSAGWRGFLWDGENIACETDGAGATVAAYRYAPSGYGALLSQRRSGATSFHHGACPERSRGDGLGSTVQLTDATQSPTDSYLYRAFGEQTVLSGSSPNPFTWVGRLGYHRQLDTSDYWVRARVYGPAVGRWVSRDPIGRRSYSYSLNAPLALADPSGLSPALLLAGAGGETLLFGSGAGAAGAGLGAGTIATGGLLLLAVVAVGGVVVVVRQHARPQAEQETSDSYPEPTSPPPNPPRKCNCREKYGYMNCYDEAAPNAVTAAKSWPRDPRDCTRRHYLDWDLWIPTDAWPENRRPLRQPANSVGGPCTGKRPGDNPGWYWPMVVQFEGRYDSSLRTRRVYSVFCCKCCDSKNRVVDFSNHCFNYHIASDQSSVGL